jgi:hypothetical protein
MVKTLLFHASYCTLHLMHCTFLSWLIFMYIRVDQAEPKSEIQANQVRKEYDDSQAPSCMDTNLDMNQHKPRYI